MLETSSGCRSRSRRESSSACCLCLAYHQVRSQLPRDPQTRRPTTCICGARRPRMTPRRTSRLSQCSSAAWGWIRPMGGPGQRWTPVQLRQPVFGGGPVAFQRSESAVERAIALDPTLIGDAAAPLILRRSEKGQLEPAYEMASALVERHPRNSRAQFALGYVFRYAGLLEDAAAQCEAAMDRDPTDRRLRSCAIVFSRLGRYGRARDFLRPDGSSEFAAAFGAEIFLREGILRLPWRLFVNFPIITPSVGNASARSCLERRSPSEIAGIARQVQVTVQSQPDPEFVYSTATLMAVCGRREEAIQLLHQAIRGTIARILAHDRSAPGAGQRPSRFCRRGERGKSMPREIRIVQRRLDGKK